MSEKKIIQFDSASQVNSDAYVPITQLVNGDQKTLKALIDQLGAYISRVQQYNDLDTTAKDLIGAINEAAQSGSIEMEQTVTTPVSIASINDGGDNIPVKSLKVLVSAVQSGSGTPSPSNIRSISGWSGADIVRTGANQWDEEVKQDYSISGTNGNDSATANTWCSKNYIYLKPNTNYYLKSTSYLNARWYDADKNYLGYSVISANTTFNSTTAFANARYLRFNGYGGSYNNDISINYPSTDTTYHAYNGTTHTIPFGQTVYGGLLDVTKGVLTITHGVCIDLGNLTWGYTSSGKFYTQNISGAKKTSGITCKCEVYNAVSNIGLSTDTMPDMSIAMMSNPAGLDRCYITDSNYTDVTLTDFVTSLSNKKLIYELATPTTIYLTPTQVKTLLTCNIFSDTGDIDTLIYFNSNADETADVVEAYVGNVVNLYATLATGNTSVTISSSAIHTNSTIDIYTDNDVDYISAVVTEGQIVINFDAQASDLGVKVRVS